MNNLDTNGQPFPYQAPKDVNAGFSLQKDETEAPNALFGAFAGDFVGSVYEFNNIKTKSFPLISRRCFMTDDSIMTLATADAIISGSKDYATFYHKWGNLYPVGYGGHFSMWLATPLEQARPYNSWGNGSAMRVSPVGLAFDTVKEVLEHARLSAEATHNHPEGIRGAQAAALAVYMARTNHSKDDIAYEMQHRFNYDLSHSLDEIRPWYSFDVSCQGTLPVALRAFLEADSYEETIRNAVSIGGDSDTIAAIAGAIALSYYKKMPTVLANAVSHCLDEKMKTVTDKFAQYCSKNKPGVPEV